MAAGRSKSGVTMFLLACLLAFVGVYLVNSQMKKKERALQAQLNKKPEVVDTVKVLFTSRPFNALEAIVPEGVVIKEIPKSFAPVDAYNNIEQIKGLYAKMPMVDDEILRASKSITKDEAENLAFQIPPGRRAITVMVNEAKGVGYQITPGDKVDVIALFPEGQGDDAPLRSQVLLQDIQVLQVVSPNVEAKKERGTRSGNPSITLAVTPNEAEVLALMEHSGSSQLVMILRPVSDDSIHMSEGTTFSSLVGQAAQPVVAASETDGSQVVEIFTGGTRTTTKVPR